MRAPLAYVAALTVAVTTAALLVSGPTADTTTYVAADNDTNVSLTVTESTSVAVDPNLFNFSDIGVGETNFSDSLDLVITNDGSTNVSNVYASMNTLESEPDNPLGSGIAAEYAAGRFFWIKNATSGFYHAGSLMWNQTEAAGGEPSGVTKPADTVSVGYYRNASGDYLWGLETDGEVNGNPVCNGTASTVNLHLKDEVDTGDNRDLTDSNTNTHVLTANTNENWSVSKVSGGPLDSHYVGAYQDCTKLYIYRFDADNRFPGSGQDDQYLIGPSTEMELAPGDEYSGRVGAAVPSGIPAGATNQTTLTVYATAQ